MQKPISTLICLIFLLTFSLLPFRSTAYGEPLARFTVETGDYMRFGTPVSLDLTGVPVGFPTDKIRLIEIKGSKRILIPSQLEPGSPPRLWWILLGKTQAASKITYEIERVKELGLILDVTYENAPYVRAVKNDSFLQIQTHGPSGIHKILRYHHAIVPAPEGQSKLYDRSAFIHPLWSPSGSVLTNIHPPDHYHHVGIWMPWTKTKFEGKEVDFWNLGSGQGTVRFKKFLSTSSGIIFGGFQAEHDHVALNTDAGEKVVLKEIWEVRAYNFGGGHWLWDFVSTQRCVADSPLLLEEYRYGGFGFRATADWKGETAAYLTSEGKTRKDGHATRARWCDTSGVTDGKWKGVTFFSHPQNFRHPEPMRIWPGFEQEVFFNWVPVQAGDFELKPGEDHVFRYRQYVHEGKIDIERTEQVWNDYAHPPKVDVETVRPGDAIILFDGEDFSHWTTGGDKDVGWKIVDGAMKITPKSGNIMTKRNFRDFKMHIEFKTPQLPPNVKGQGRGNSGIYIQRRYELQILDSYGLEPKKNECGSLYKFRAPDKNVCRMPGRWQSYDIIFHAARFDGNRKTEKARITVWHNGVLIHDDVKLDNKTGAGRPEGLEPGPILLQDHGNEVLFRNIWIVPL
ncbi:MAG: PmoA family protein [Planctomycetes bacterium]|nr:PmoA family protein [Planctomycetota bacterium]